MDATESRAGLVNGVSAAAVGIGMVTFAIFPFAVPILTLTAVAVAPLALPVLPVLMLAALARTVTSRVRGPNAIRRGSSRRHGYRLAGA